MREPEKHWPESVLGAHGKKRCLETIPKTIPFCLKNTNGVPRRPFLRPSGLRRLRGGAPVAREVAGPPLGPQQTADAEVR